MTKRTFVDKPVLVVYNDGQFTEPITFRFPVPYGVQLFEPVGILEYIYRECNHVNGNEWISKPEQQKMFLRSMSVGDMVMMDGDLWICATCGWQKA